MMALTSQAAVQAVLRHREGAAVVSTMSAMRWMDTLSTDALDLSVVPLMGGASAVGLGLAIGRPDRTVIVLDGDGSLLMQLGSLSTIAAAAPRNLHHVVFSNGVWYEGGANIGLPGGRQDFVGFALAAGYRAAANIDSLGQLDAALADIKDQVGPRLLSLVISPSSDRLWSATNPQHIHSDTHFSRMGNDIRRLRRLATLDRQGGSPGDR